LRLPVEASVGDEGEADLHWSQLMAAAQDGDRAAYERLLREIVPFIRAVVSRQHRARDRVEEVTQEVLLTLHRVRHTYDPARPFRHWLAAIARRRSIDALRRRLRTEAHEVVDEHAYETFPDPAANRVVEVSAARDGLGEAIAGLTPPQREAIELLKLREMSLAEAASVSGRSIAALKVNVHRAVKALRRRLGGEEE
jgi:RNA polymerase sigma-70 factor, ECF subfamily